MTAEAQPDQTIDTTYLTGVFAPVTDEVDVAGLEVVGSLPAELDGAYLRNGPNPRFSPIGSYLYPLDGDGMVHRVILRDGRARYTNRFVRTPALAAEENVGHALWPGITAGYRPGADQVGAALAGTTRDMPDINVVRHGGKLLALAESKRPFRLGPALETLGAEAFDGNLPAGITAHPKIDPVTGEMAVFCYHLHPPFLTWSMIRPDGTAQDPTPVDGVARPSMIHDMALTEHYLVLVIAPLFFDIAQALAGGSLMSWEPDAGTRIALIPRDGGPVRWCQTDPFWLWHTANAYQREDPTGGSTVVLDYVEWSQPEGFAPGAPALSGALARATIDPASGAVQRRVLTDDHLEFPRIDDRRLTGPHGVIATACDSGRPRPQPDAPDGLTWFDPHTEQTQRWIAKDLAVGEPAFAPHPDREDTGWWLTFATDQRDGESWLLVIPSADPAGGPQARVRLPVRVPLGLHGNWLPTEEPGNPPAGSDTL